MTTSTAALLGLGCLVIAGIVTWEVTADISAGVHADSGAGAGASKADAGVADILTPPNSDASVEIILAHPLFNASRLPISDTAKTEQVIAAPEPFHRRLTGVVIESVVREAVFAGEGGAHGIVVREGGAIEGWTVDSITPGAVTVRSAASTQVLELKEGKGKAPADRPAAKAEPPSFNLSLGAPSARRER
jgi:hypothetical protein